MIFKYREPIEGMVLITGQAVGGKYNGVYSLRKGVLYDSVIGGQDIPVARLEKDTAQFIQDGGKIIEVKVEKIIKI